MANIYGSSSSETLTGTASDDSIDGYGGDDTLVGGDGWDVLRDEEGANALYGDSTDAAALADGNDTLIGGTSNLLVGGGGNDWLQAAGSSTLLGGAGNDVLDAGTNVNVLEGGAGADTLRGTGTIRTDSAGDGVRTGGDRVELSLATAQAYGVYDILDFKAGAGGDVLGLHGLLADLVPAGFDFRNPLIDLVAFAANGSRVVTGANSWVRLVQVGADVEVQVDPSGPSNGSSYQAVAVLRGVTVGALVADNFSPPFNLDGSVRDAVLQASGTVMTLDGNDTVTDNAGPGFPDQPGVSVMDSTISTGWGNDRVVLNGGDDTVMAGAGDDTIEGSASIGGGHYHGDDGNDLMTLPASGTAYGDGGNDTVTGGFAEDSLYGGAGNDLLAAGGGNDFVFGEDGRDTLDGGSGSDYLDGGSGDDRLTAGVANVHYSTDPAHPEAITYQEVAGSLVEERDYLRGGADSDTLISGAGNDTLEDREGANILIAGSGNDTLVAGISNWVQGGSGDDDIEAGASSTVSGGDGNDVLRMRGLSILANAGAGDDRIELGDRNVYAAGEYTLGTGRDTVVFSVLALVNGATPVVIDDFVTGAGGDRLDVNALLGGLVNYSYDNPFFTGHLRMVAMGQDTMLQANVDGRVDANWQDVALLRNTAPAAFNVDNFLPPRLDPHGNATPEVFVGGSPSDTWIGYEGSDQASGLAGDDFLDGGFGGNDTLVGGAGSDTLFGWGGDDRLIGDVSDGSVVGAGDAIFGGAGNDWIEGGDGDDAEFLFYTYKGLDFYGVFGLHGGTGNDSIFGGDGRDQIDGDEGNDWLEGGTGADTLQGGVGNDTAYGGAGNDTLYGNAATEQGSDVMDGGAGDDSLTSFGANDTLRGGDDNDTLAVVAGTTGLQRLEGGAGNDTLSNATAWYDQGGDTLDGGAGDDLISVGGVGNLVAGGTGADRIDLEPISWIPQTGTGEVYLAALPDPATPGVTPTDTDVDVIELSYRGIEAGHAAPVVHAFQVGAGGDKIDLASVLGRLSELGFTFGNPFTTGWLRLAPDGADTRLQVDAAGAGANWQDIAILRDVDTSTDAARRTMLTYNFTSSFGLDGVHIDGTDVGETISDSVGIGGVFTGDGPDTVLGLGGNDLLDGAFGGDDRLVGGAGRDTLFGFDGNDVLFGDAVDASVPGDSDLVFGGAGNDEIHGGDGGDYDYLGVEYKGVSYAGFRGLEGGAGNDTIFGDGGRDLLVGDDGDDRLDGGADHDTVTGGHGSDTLIGGGGDDNLEDNDSVDNAGNLLQGGLGADTLVSGGANDTLEGGDDNDDLSAQGVNATLRGGGGDDLLRILPVAESRNLLEGGDGNDTLRNIDLWSEEGNDTLDGGAGNDQITVSGVGNLIAGGTGADRIDLEANAWMPQTGTGEIYLAGLPGSTATTDTDIDTVELSLRGIEQGHAAPVIHDFHTGAGGDRIALDSVLGRLSELGYTFDNPFTTGWLRLLQDGADTRLQVDRSGTGTAWKDLAIVLDTSATAFTLENFEPRVSPSGFVTGEFLVGTDDADTISDTVGVAGRYAVDGSDTILGLAGDDFLDGGFGGNDRLVGGPGRDTLFGFDGNDVLFGDTPDASGVGDIDLVFGGAGDDEIHGGDGGDYAYQYLTYKGVPYSGFRGLEGGAGNDTIFGEDGRDLVLGEDGNDRLDGGADNDTVEGGHGSDTLMGGAGDDYLADNDSVDNTGNLLQGGTGADSLFSGGADDTLEGGDDNDELSSQSHNATLRGGDGNDVLRILSVADARNLLEGGEGNDTLGNILQWTEEGNDTLDGGAGDDVITASGVGNVVVGGTGADRIDLEANAWMPQTGSGEIYLAGLPGSAAPTDSDIDTVEVSLRGIEQGHAVPVIHDFHTGAGGDRIDLDAVLGRLSERGYTYQNPFTTGWLRLLQDGADTRLQVDRSGAADGAQWQDVALVLQADAASFTIDNFTPRVAPGGLLTPAVLNGSALDETLTESRGIAGNFAADASDTIEGHGGNDFLDGGFGGDDRLVGGVGRDTLFGFDGNDVLFGDTADDSATGDIDLIFGGAGNDEIHGGDAGDHDYVELTYKGIQYTGWRGLEGGAGDDTIFGEDGRDYLLGETGNDVLDGGADADTLEGGHGSDTLMGGAGDDYLGENDWADNAGNLLQGGSGADTLSSGGSNDTLEGGEDNDDLTSQSMNATLRGQGGDDVLRILSTADTSNLLEGGDGNDTLRNVIAWREEGHDTLDGGAGDDQITASGGGNLVAGGSGADRIDLESNPWVPLTGSGEIYLAGLPGSATPTDTDIDTVRVSLRGIEQGHAAAAIHDFHTGAGGDLIDLEAVLGRLGELGMAPGADPFAQGWLRLTRSGADTVLEADRDGAAGTPQFEAVAILRDTASASFTAANFVQGFVPVVSANPEAPVLQADKSLALLEDSQSNSLGLVAPADPDGGAVSIRVEAVPEHGQVRLADGSTVVTAGQALTGAELVGLTFTPDENYRGPASVLRYAVQDEEGSVARGVVDLCVTSVPDPHTGTNAVAGDAIVGQPVWVSWNVQDGDNIGVINYQWFAGGVAIDGATGSYYTPIAADHGKQLTVFTSYVDGDGTTETDTSTASAAVRFANIAPSGTVTIAFAAGDTEALQGHVLTATASLADGNGLGSLAYQWLSNGGAIAGATADTFAPTQAQVGAAISVQVTYTDGEGYSERVDSAATGLVVDTNDAPTGTLTIAGEPEQGQWLTYVDLVQDADGKGAASYQWFADGVAIDGAVGGWLLLTQAEVGTAITVRASYTDGLGNLEQVTSAPGAAVRNVNDDPQGSVTIAGTAEQGQTLVASNSLSDIDGMPGPVGYRWLSDGIAITGASGDHFTLAQEHVGHSISVLASYLDGYGQPEVMQSTATQPVLNVNDAPSGALTISGQGVQGATLDVTSTLGDLDGLGALAFQWSAGGVAIQGATAASYTLTAAEVGKAITVTATYVDGFGHPETVSSAATGPVEGPSLAGLSGMAYQWKGHALLAGLTVDAHDASAEDYQAVTGDDGTFHFQLPPGDCTMTATRPTADSGNAVTSADALAALRIAVGINPNPDPDAAGPLVPLKVSPYQFIAADANMDGRVTSADALAILRMAVKSSAAPAQQWLFVGETQDLWDEANQASALTRLNVGWNPGTTAHVQTLDTTANLVGVLLGDVNGSWTPPTGSQDLDVNQPTYIQNLAATLNVPTDIWGI